MPVHESDFVLFSGNSNQALAREVCEYLGQPLGKCAVTHFSDGETQVEIGENVRGRDVFLLQSTSTPVNDHLMELLILIDAARRASAEQITAVIPYFGYARQDRKVAPRTPITARLVADLITSAGADRFVSMDLHAGQIQGFFDMPSDHLYASPILLDHMRKTFPNPEEVVIISPDAGRVKTGVILDDMVDTAGTLTQGAKAVSDAGAKRVMAYAVHPVLSGPAIQRIEDSVIEKVVVTNTIPLSPAARESKKISQLSVAKIFGEAIRRIHEADSLSSLFV